MSLLADSSMTANGSASTLLQSKAVINPGKDDQLDITGYRRDALKTILFYVLVVVTLGIILLVEYWKPELECYLKCKECALYNADVILIKRYAVQRAGSRTDKWEQECGVVDVKLIAATEDKYDASVSYQEADGSSVPSGTGDRGMLISPTTIQGMMRYFDYQHYRYIWDVEQRAFKELEDLSTSTPIKTILEGQRGLENEVRASRKVIYGDNAIDIEVKSYFRLLIEEVLTPFYIFQIGSIILWMFDQYYYYAGCILVVSGLSIGISLYETKKQRVTLRNMMAIENHNLLVADGEDGFNEVSERELVPGDVIAVPAHGCVMTCDAVLITGTCIVNESMLTGESVPVTKTPLTYQDDDEVYSPEVHKRHTLFSGTRVVQTRYYGNTKVLAVVVRTGYSTAKGELVCAILYPKPLDFKFYQDSVKFILFLAVMASLGMVYSLIMYIRNGAPVDQMIKRLLDIITIIVPPALPAAMTVGTVYAQSRLKKHGIFCISPPRINFCGRINAFCFDKTGTLTEDGLDMWGVVPVQDKHFHDVQHDPSKLERSPLLLCLATCHSLTIIDGDLSGDPLDLIMFNAIKWHLEEPGQDTSKYDTIMPTVVRPYSKETFLGEEEKILSSDELFENAMAGRWDQVSDEDLFNAVHPFEVGIIRQFTFSSATQRMSVITRTIGQDHMELYCKGAPEKIASLCLPDSLPHNFSHILHKYTVQGFRVIALAYRQLDPKITWHQVQRIPRDKVEYDLEFLGLLVMQNQLKPQTTPVIHTLARANIRTVMITGDMIQTAVSVARECGMVRPCDKVIIVHGHPPDKEHPAARIEWELAEAAEDPELVDEEESSNERRPLLKKRFKEEGFTLEETSEGVNEVVEAKETPTEDELERRELSILGNAWIRDRDENKPSRGCLCFAGCCDKGGYQAIKIADYEPRTHLAVTGKAFAIIENHFPELMPKVCVLGTVFARMSPDQKCALIEYLQEYEYIVGMCGDGANDCEALKAAHAGISLSEAEASVAAPFTSRVNNIECVITAMREGRCALVTSFACFKYMALYSFIQFISVLILYTMQTNLSDLEFLYIDLIITTTIAVLLGNTGAFQKLVRHKPPDSLVKLSNIISIMAQVGLAATFQLGILFYLMDQQFYKDNDAPAKETDTWESTIIFLSSSFMYISVAVSFSKGPPFRKPLYTNVPFLVAIIVLYAFSAFMLLWPQEPIENFMEMKPLHSISFTFRLTIFCVSSAFLVLSGLLEWLFVDSGLMKWCYRRIHTKEKSRYKAIQDTIISEDWPAVGQTTFANSDDVAIDMNSTSH